MENAIPEEEIPNFILEVESHLEIWNYRIQTSFKKKQQEMAAVAAVFNVPCKRAKIYQQIIIMPIKTTLTICNLLSLSEVC